MTSNSTEIKQSARDNDKASATDSALRIYMGIARPDHWVKNIFMVPGTAAAIALMHPDLAAVPGPMLRGFASLCLAASANYTINEFLDAKTDRFHPTKSQRAGSRGLLLLRYVLLQYGALGIAACVFAWPLGAGFMLAIAGLLAMGVAYNVPPLRLKDKAYCDTLSESLNNPLRFLMGWLIVAPSTVPPGSALLAYWMGGAFLMGVKRFTEFRSIGDPVRAALYRRSFAHYTEQSLLLTSFFYAVCAAFFIAIFLIKYRVELLLTAPLFALLFTWYLALGLRRDSAAQAPEALYRGYGLLGLAAATFAAVGALFAVDIPALHSFMNPHVISLKQYLP